MVVVQQPFSTDLVDLFLSVSNRGFVLPEVSEDHISGCHHGAPLTTHLHRSEIVGDSVGVELTFVVELRGQKRRSLGRTNFARVVEVSVAAQNEARVHSSLN